MKTLQEIKEIEFDFIKKLGGYWNLTEFDKCQNTITRCIIRAFKQERGQAWLGNINRHGINKPPYELREYRKGMVYNFEYGFIIPCHDQALIDLIVEREKAPYTGTKDDIPRVDAIMERIYEIGGMSLIWV